MRIQCGSSLVVDLARGAAHMHSIGFVHRDIKPDNLLVFRTDSGLQGKITDFSLSRGERIATCSGDSCCAFHLVGLCAYCKQAALDSRRR